MTPLPVLKDDLVATGKDLKWLLDLLQAVELHGAGFVKGFEIGRVYKVGHRNAVDVEAKLLDRIRTLVRIHDLRIRACRHHVDGRVDQHLYELVRCRHAYEVTIVQRCLDEDLGLRQSIRGEIVIGEGAWLIGIVEKDHRPGAFHESS